MMLLNRAFTVGLWNGRANACQTPVQPLDKDLAEV